MKEITTKSGKLLLVKVPKLAFYFDWEYSKKNFEPDYNSKIKIYWETLDERRGMIITNFTNSNQFEILGKFSELRDDDFEEFCELNNALKEAQKIFPRKDLSIHVDANNWKYTNYLFPHDYYFGLQYAKDSFETLVKSQGLDDSLDDYLIIKVL